ncbi:MAG: hypothetical protein V3R49_04180 [Gammaproteobacteria bacterium]
MAGLFGEELISIAPGFGKEKQQVQSAESPVKMVHRIQTVAVVEQRTATVHHHWLGRGARSKGCLTPGKLPSLPASFQFLSVT